MVKIEPAQDGAKQDQASKAKTAAEARGDKDTAVSAEVAKREAEGREPDKKETREAESAVKAGDDSGPRYELEADHYLPGDQFVERGSVIGAGTRWPFLDRAGKPLRPSHHMRPLNPAAEKLVAKLSGDRSPIDQLPISQVPNPENPNKEAPPKDA